MPLKDYFQIRLKRDYQTTDHFEVSIYNQVNQPDTAVLIHSKKMGQGFPSDDNYFEFKRKVKDKVEEWLKDKLDDVYAVLL